MVTRPLRRIRRNALDKAFEIPSAMTIETNTERNSNWFIGDRSACHWTIGRGPRHSASELFEPLLFRDGLHEIGFHPKNSFRNLTRVRDARLIAKPCSGREEQEHQYDAAHHVVLPVAALVIPENEPLETRNHAFSLATDFKPRLRRPGSVRRRSRTASARPGEPGRSVFQRLRYARERSLRA